MDGLLEHADVVGQRLRREGEAARRVSQAARFANAHVGYLAWDAFKDMA